MRIIVLILATTLIGCLKQIETLNEEDIFSKEYSGPIWFEQSSEYSTDTYRFFRYRIRNYQLSHTNLTYSIIFQRDCEGPYDVPMSLVGNIFKIKVYKASVVDESFKISLSIDGPNGIGATFCHDWEF
ncbi:MAG: hypothetical protein GQ574_23875 [Crocinitomix sp.]|nr:hypothetical protein [Crocinitomix sp.]